MKKERNGDDLLKEVFRGKLSPDSDIFKAWLEADADNERKFNGQISLLAKEQRIADGLDTDRLYGRVMSGIFRENARKRRIRFIQYAAMLLIPVFSGLIYFLLVPTGNELEPYGGSARPSLAGNAVTLTLPEGKAVLLTKLDTLRSGTEETSIALHSGDRKVYRTNDPNSLNTLKTPSLCDFSFMLSDGTRVWMNALSTLKYPVAFTGKERTIYASGEVYLEVAKNPEKPFFVVLDGMKIEVLGTSFNINAYPDDNTVEVTLVEGHVKAYADSGNYDLFPDNQLCMDKTTEHIAINRVNALDVTAWKDGRYIFKGKPLLEVARVLKRWYGVELIFECKTAEQKIFTGVVDKEESIDVFLDRLGKTSRLDCRKIGEKVYIR